MGAEAPACSGTLPYLKARSKRPPLQEDARLPICSPAYPLYDALELLWCLLDICRFCACQGDKNCGSVRAQLLCKRCWLAMGCIDDRACSAGRRWLQAPAVPTIMPAMNVEICCVKLAVCVARAPSVEAVCSTGHGLLKRTAS